MNKLSSVLAQDAVDPILNMQLQLLQAVFFQFVLLGQVGFVFERGDLIMKLPVLFREVSEFGISLH
jgi:hypothetical protein